MQYTRVRAMPWRERCYCLPHAELCITYDSRRCDVVEASLCEEMVAALTEEGGIDPQVVRAEALRLYLNTHPALKLDGAVALWRNNRISLARAAETATCYLDNADSTARSYVCQSQRRYPQRLSVLWLFYGPCNSTPSGMAWSGEAKLIHRWRYQLAWHQEITDDP